MLSRRPATTAGIWAGLSAIVALFCRLPLAPVAGQQTEPSSESGFDGQPVSAVEIAAGPNVAVDSMRQLIRLQMHQFSAAKSIPQLGGSASSRGTVTGTAKNPRAQGELAAQNLSVGGSRWKSLSLNLKARSSSLRIENGTLAENPCGQITLSGAAGLDDWSLASSSPISFNAKVADISIEDAEKIAERHYPVSGTVAANISAKRTRENPETDGTITLTHASAWNEPINKLTLNARSNQATIQSTASLEVAAGTISEEGAYKLGTDQQTFEVHSKGLRTSGSKRRLWN